MPVIQNSYLRNKNFKTMKEFKKQTPENFNKQNHEQKINRRGKTKINKLVRINILESYFQNGYLKMIYIFLNS